jgi:hypothetical protein
VLMCWHRQHIACIILMVEHCLRVWGQSISSEAKDAGLVRQGYGPAITAARMAGAQAAHLRASLCVAEMHCAYCPLRDPLHLRCQVQYVLEFLPAALCPPDEVHLAPAPAGIWPAAVRSQGVPGCATLCHAVPPIRRMCGALWHWCEMIPSIQPGCGLCSDGPVHRNIASSMDGVVR